MTPRQGCRHVLIFTVTLMLIASTGRHAAAEKSRPPGRGRMWPVEIPINLSSSFGEFRSGHLHAGLDIRTFGREGIPCLAVDSGYVSRLRSSPFGYGKAVYVKLRTGETVVYAHLSEFPPPIDSVLFDGQMKEGNYRVDLHLQPDRLPIARGDIVGYTGRTGTVAPHLHFEVRDENENPLNPLDIGWKLEDTSPPNIRRVRWLPLSPSSRVDGACAPKTVKSRGIDAYTFAVSDTVDLRGRIGLAVQVIDRLNGKSGRLAPFRVELFVDGRHLSSVEFKSFTYGHTGEVELAYDMARVRSTGEHYLFLFHRTGETLWNRVFENDGVIDTDELPYRQGAAEGVHIALVRAVDRWGHVSVASIPFRVSNEPVAGDTAGVSDTGAYGADGSALPGTMGRWNAWCGEIADCYFFEDMVSFPGSALGGSGGGDSRHGGSNGERGDLVLSLGDGDFGESEQTLKIGCREDLRVVHLIPIRKGEAVVREFPDIGTGISVLEASLYSDVIFYVARWERDVRRTPFPRDALSPVTPGIRLGPTSLVLKGSIEIRIVIDRPAEGREAIYRFDDRKERWLYRSSFVRGDTLAAFVREPGIYAVFVDSVAPRVAAPVVQTRKSYATGERFREIVIGITDGGSGVNVEEVEVYLDGNTQIARWDGFLEKMFVLLRNRNIIGVQDLSVRAVDREGNTSTLDVQINIPALEPKEGGVETDSNAP